MEGMFLPIVVVITAYILFTTYWMLAQGMWLGDPGAPDLGKMISLSPLDWATSIWDFLSYSAQAEFYDSSIGTIAMVIIFGVPALTVGMIFSYIAAKFLWRVG